jgi:hypothetical protein
MNVRPLALVLLLAACASAPEQRVEAEPVALQRFDYSTAVRALPAGTSRVSIRVRIPDVWPTGVLMPIGLHGLMGNAPFEWNWPELEPPTNSITHQATFTIRPDRVDDYPRIAWSSGEEDGVRYREVVVETVGKPLELSVRVERMAGAPVERAELERRLAGTTTATVDGVAVDALAVHLRELN